MVLEFLRKKTRSVFTYVVFGLIIVVFVLYFGYGRIGEKREDWVAKVNGQPISYQDYRAARDRLQEFYEEMNKTTLDQNAVESLGLKKQAYEMMVDNCLLHQTAEEMGFAAPKAEIREIIVTTPAFQRDGVFDADIYKRVLWQSKAKLTPEEYEARIAIDLVNSRMRTLVQDAVKCSERELWDAYQWENEKINLTYVEIDPSTMGISSPSSEEVKQYYNEHKAEFREPEKIKVKYVEFRSQAYEGQVDVSTAEIEKYYEDFSEEFWQPAQVRARHILIRVSPEQGPEAKTAAKRKAEEVLAMVKSGKPFEDLAKKFSQDPGSAKNGGDLGFFPRGRMVKPFEDAAFSLKAGEVSDLVETQFGYHVIKAEEVREEGLRPLEEVKEEIFAKIREEKTLALIKKEAFRGYRTLVKTKNLDEYAKGVGVTVTETDYFSRTAGRDPFQEMGEAGLDALFAQSAGDIFYPFLARGSFFVGQVVDKKPSETPTLDVLKAKIENELRRQRQNQAAQEKAKAMVGEARKLNSLEALAKKEKLVVRETGVFTRTGGYIPGIGSSQDLVVALSQLSPLAPLGQEAFEVSGKYYLVELKEKAKVAQEEFEAKKKDFQKTYQSQKISRAYKGWMDYTRSRAKVIQNPERPL